MQKYRHQIMPIIFSLIIMSIGCIIFAIGFNVFIFPLRFLTGGVTGVSVIVYEIWQITPAYTQWALNIPLFFLGWGVIGHAYALRIIYGSFFLPFLVKLTEGLNNVNLNIPPIVSLILGGIMIGLGLGLILDANGSTGGLDIPARIISRSFNISLGISIGIVDSLVITSGIIAFELLNGTGLQQGLYALVFVFIMTMMIDLVTIKKPGHNILRNVLIKVGIMKN